MTSISKLLASSCAGLALAALLGILCDDSQAADRSIQSRDSGEVLDLRTEGLPSPVLIPGDPLKRHVTSFEIRGKLVKGGNGKGAVTLDESPFSFNDFGDSRKIKSEPSKACQVAFKKLPQGDKSESRRLYEVVFNDGSLPGRMFLLLSSGATGPHRLLVSGDSKPPRKDGFHPAQIIDLKGLPEITASLPEAPRGASFELSTLSSAHGGNKKGLQGVTISGSTDGPASLSLNPNYLSFNAFGDVVMTTLIGHQALPATLQRIAIPDPMQQNRLLFEVVTKDDRQEGRYFLVLAPTQAGPHRLLIRKGGSLSHVLPMTDPSLQYHLSLQRQLAACSLQEQQAVKELRNTIGFGFEIKIESASVTELHISSGGDAARVDSALKGLTKLKTLEFSRSRLGPTGLPNLRHLADLKILRFSGAEIADGGLASVRQVPGLMALSFYDCRGITDEGLAHLEGLKHLKGLQLYREDFLKPGQPGAPRITDAGLAHLRGLTGLTSLNLMGQAITDAGLEHLKDLVNLTELCLAGDGITDAGLVHLKGMTRLKYLHLYNTRITEAGKATLKAKQPLLMTD